MWVRMVMDCIIVIPSQLNENEQSVANPMTDKIFKHLWE